MDTPSAAPRSGATTLLAWVVLVALAVLAYDSGRDALGAYRSGRLAGPHGSYVVRTCDATGCTGDFTPDGDATNSGARDGGAANGGAANDGAGDGGATVSGVPLDSGGSFREGERGRVVLSDGRAVPLRGWGYQAAIGAGAALAAVAIGLWLLRRRRTGDAWRDRSRQGDTGGEGTHAEE